MYRGYPEYVVITLPKSGTKTLHKVFESLGHKVFDMNNMNDFAFEFDSYGKGEKSFAQIAKTIWEDNQFDVIVEPAGLYWYEMVNHWPKTKFIHLTRDVESWTKSLKTWMKSIHDIPKGSMPDMLFYNNEHISPTAHYGLHRCLEPYSLYIVGYAPLFMDNKTDYDDIEPWERMFRRKHRLFEADVKLNAPKDRTLLDYNIKDGWPKLAKFMGVKPTSENFPHENKAKLVVDFHKNLWSGSDYEKKVEDEFKSFFKQNGYSIEKIKD